ncbi:hypothetical protein PUN28_012476 [Cardiocondyla obscurior]|uniref:Uncharacterized protein n=1 Tax=Cardiocondyla obscurior TaxID=286306 RepID=A0AAW2FHE7_9HYME
MNTKLYALYQVVSRCHFSRGCFRACGYTKTYVGTASAHSGTGRRKPLTWRLGVCREGSVICITSRVYRG